MKFPGGENGVLGDRSAAVAPFRVLETGLVAQGVHQPGLACGLGMNAVNCRRRKPLTGLFRVLAQQRLHFRPVEIAEPQRRSTDVEPPAARTHVTAIVRHLTHPTEHDAVREPVRPFVVAGTQLAQYRRQHVARQGIDLVDQQHQGTRIASARCRRASRSAEPGLPAASTSLTMPASESSPSTVRARSAIASRIPAIACGMFLATLGRPR